MLAEAEAVVGEACQRFTACTNGLSGLLMLAKTLSRCCSKVHGRMKSNRQPHGSANAVIAVPAVHAVALMAVV